MSRRVTRQSVRLRALSLPKFEFNFENGSARDSSRTSCARTSGLQPLHSMNTPPDSEPGGECETAKPPVKVHGDRCIQKKKKKGKNAIRELRKKIEEKKRRLEELRKLVKTVKKKNTHNQELPASASLPSKCPNNVPDEASLAESLQRKRFQELIPQKLMRACRGAIAAYKRLVSPDYKPIPRALTEAEIVRILNSDCTESDTPPSEDTAVSDTERSNNADKPSQAEKKDPELEKVRAEERRAIRRAEHERRRRLRHPETTLPPRKKNFRARFPEMKSALVRASESAVAASDGLMKGIQEHIKKKETQLKMRKPPPNRPLTIPELEDLLNQSTVPGSDVLPCVSNRVDEEVTVRRGTRKRKCRTQI